MQQGFFSQSELAQSRPPLPTIARCGACGLLNNCHSPRMRPTGDGRRRVLIVAEAPGRTEDERGIQLIGDAGQELRRILRSIDVDLDRDCVKTNAIICRPPGNRTPTDAEVEHCHPYLVKTLERVKPHVIIPLGHTAVRAVLLGVWKDDVGEMSRWAGCQIPDQTRNVWICPTWHPSYILRTKDPVIELQLKDHLSKAFELADERPWKEVPKWKKEVKIIKDHHEATQILDRMTESGKPISFDFETNTLRPENKGASIISCAVCWAGRRTIAYPWVGTAREATRRLLHSSAPKIGYNIKFEERWCKKEFGKGVRNWVLDGQIAVHCESSRRGSKSLEFQAFVKFGFPPYDKHIKPFLKAKGASPINRIVQDIGLDDLLLYNGLDALLEYNLAKLIAKLYGYTDVTL